MNETSPPHKAPLLVTAAVIIEANRVLITRRPDHKPHGGWWEFPGGKLNPDETPTAALQRELVEELNLTIHVDQIIDALYHNYEWGPVLVLAYSCRITAGVPHNIEVAEHRWVPLAELGDYQLLPADLPLVERLRQPIRQ